MSHDSSSSLHGPVGLFPLPNVVLFPGATLPLQVFEPRYRTMIRDALDRDQLIAMALLLPGYEGYYYTNLAEISPVVCVGRIREHVQIPDGRYFINLHGLCRARVTAENRDGDYRRAQLEVISPKHNPLAAGLESDLRHAMQLALSKPLFAQLGEIDKCRAALQRSAPLDELLDLIAAILLPPDAVDIKQRLLEEFDILQRAAILLTELRRLEQILERQHRSTDQWPRTGSLN